MDERVLSPGETADDAHNFLTETWFPHGNDAIMLVIR